ncbi:hypothetical protein ACHAWF_017914 [Thalassiosira exigua]
MFLRPTWPGLRLALAYSSSSSSEEEDSPAEGRAKPENPVVVVASTSPSREPSFPAWLPSPPAVPPPVRFLLTLVVVLVLVLVVVAIIIKQRVVVPPPLEAAAERPVVAAAPVGGGGRRRPLPRPEDSGEDRSLASSPAIAAGAVISLAVEGGVLRLHVVFPTAVRVFAVARDHVRVAGRPPRWCRDRPGRRGRVRAEQRVFAVARDPASCPSSLRSPFPFDR